jgi:hypothetical protein
MPPPPGLAFSSCRPYSMSGDEQRYSPCVKALRLYKVNALDLLNLENIAKKPATQVWPATGGGLTRTDSYRCAAAIGSYSFLVERDLAAGLNEAALEVRGGPRGHARARFFRSRSLSLSLSLSSARCGDAQGPRPNAQCPMPNAQCRCMRGESWASWGTAPSRR